MPRLRRAFYDNIGVTAARFMDLTVPFTGADGSATDSVILLKNGGGKSALLSLIFSVIRPALREFMRPREDKGRGREDDVRALGDYVLRDDHGVVVLEWELDNAPEVNGQPVSLLTGVFLERKPAASRPDGTADADGGIRRVYFSYYSVSDAAQTALESLPLYTDASRRFRYPSPGFVARLDDIADAAPHAQVIHTEQQNEWNAALLSRGIDADIFAYQLRMNQREGGAKDLFAACTSVEAYLDLFLEVLADRSLGEGLRNNLAQHREKLIRRKTELVPGRILTAALVDALVPIRQAAAERTGLRDTGRALASRLHALQTYCAARLASLGAARSDLAVMQETAAEDAAVRQRESAAARRRAASLQRDIALVTAQAAQTEKTRIDREKAETDRLARGWQLAGPLRDARLQEANAQRHRDEVAEREREHAPLLERAKTAARAFWAALAAQAVDLSDRLETIEQEIRELDDSAEEARKTAERDGKIVATERERERRFTDRAREIARDHHRLVVDEVVVTREEPLADAEVRVTDALAAAKRDEAAATASLADASKAVAVRHAAVATTTTALEGARRESALVAQRLDVAERDGRRIGELASLRRVLEVDSVDPTTLGDDAVLLVRQAAHRAYERALATRARSALARRNVAALRDTGLLPCSTDVELVLSVLKPAIRQAHAGWEFIADAMTVADASTVVDRAPDIAVGIVVGDHEFDHAIALLKQTTPQVEAPVRITRQSEIAVAGRVAPPAFVARPTTNAHFDRAEGAMALPRLETHLATLDGEAAAADADHQGLQSDATTLHNFLRSFGAAWFAEQRRLAAAAESAVAEAEQAVATATEAQARAEDDERAARAALDEAESSDRVNGQKLRDLRAFRERYGDDITAAERTAKEARLAADEAERRAADATVLRSGFRARAEEAQTLRIGVASDRAVLERAMREVRYIDAPIAPVPGDRAALEQAYRLAVDSYDQKIDSRGLLALAEEADHQARRKREELRSGLGKQRFGWTEDSLVDLLDSLPTGSDVQAELERVSEAGNQLFSKSGHAGTAVAQAASALKEARGACALVGTPLSMAEEEERLASLGADADGEQRRVWQQARAEAVAIAERAEADAVAAQAVREEAERELAKVIQAETAVRGSLALVDTAEGQQGEFLRQFAVDAVRAADAAPVDDGALGSATPEWIAERSALLESWQSLDGKRDKACRKISGILGGADPVIVPPLLARLRDADPAIVEVHVEEVADDIQRRHDEIGRAIADVDVHRRELVELALLAGEEGRRRIKALGHSAIVPRRVMTFGGKAFLTVKGTDAADAAVERAAIESLLETLTAADVPVPTALTLIQMATRALLPDVRMDVLYPKPEQVKPEYWPITRLGKMSGGEGLTIATLLYCTLARVRAEHRGARGAASGVLLFDNPFGIASSATFITMQREVARAFGVQLIYFTGVLDLEAIRLLPNRVRLGATERDRARGFMLVRPIAGDPIAEALRDADAAAERPMEPVQLIAANEAFLYDGIVETREQPSITPDQTTESVRPVETA